MGLSNILDENVILRGSKRSLIKTPSVLTAAREHFGCETITGVEIENEDDSGSHWEKIFLYNELMTSTTLPNAALSKFTLALLQDTGWYQVNTSNAE